MSETIIYGALDIELRGIIRRAERRKVYSLGSTKIYFCYYGSRKVTIVKTGMGKEKALAAVDNLSKLVKDDTIGQVFIVGIGGATSKKLGAGKIVYYKDIVKVEQKEGRLTSSLPLSLDPVETGGYKEVRGATLSFLAADRVIKNEIYSRLGAEVVDMESFYIAEKYRKQEIPVTVIRAVSDTSSQDLPLFFKDFSCGRKLAGIAHLIGCMARSECRHQALNLYRNTRTAIFNLTAAVKKLALD